MFDRNFTARLERWIGEGVDGAALVARRGEVVAISGSISEEEAMPLAALVMYRLKTDDLAPRLFTGEILSMSLETRDIAVAVAKRQLFVVASLDTANPAALARVRDLHADIEAMLADLGDTHSVWMGDSGGSGGSGSAPAELQLVELGITVPRAKA